MNFGKRLKCWTCDTIIDCRVGMSNRDKQHLRFACPSCAEAIEIIINKSFKYKGAASIEKFEGPFTGEYPFVDLHQDFPVTFTEYVQGETPFLKAIKRIGHEKFLFHNERLEALNYLYPLAPDIKRIIRLYTKKNMDLFCRLAKKIFNIECKSNSSEDINLVLYNIVSKVFSPFSISQEVGTVTNQFSKLTLDLAKTKKSQFDKFIKEIIDSNFLQNIQSDCLEIYPKIYEAELALRPALYLDFDEDYDSRLVAFRVSTNELESYKDLYKDISEILSRQLILIAGLNNIIHRNDFNNFFDMGKGTPKNLNDYADKPFGLKLKYLDSSWYDFDPDIADNHLRNSIAHYKIEYNDVTQKITYFPRREGIKQDKASEMYFLDFMRKLLLSYREMHKLHHLIKCLFNYYYMIYKRN